MVGAYKIVLLLVVISPLLGCQVILRIVYKEASEEKKILGDTYGYNPKVEKVQMILDELGFPPGKIDGKLGPNTRGAIKEFQRKYNIKTTGFVDKITWGKLNIFHKLYSIPLEEVTVKDIQFALKEAGFDPGPIDGKIGRRTVKAIRAFQKAHNLISDGTVGKRTWRKLRKYYFEFKLREGEKRD